MENLIESMMFRGRWILAPMYFGLVFGLAILLLKFFQELYHIVVRVFETSEREVVLSLLTLVDITLVANLLIMVIFSGYENFVSKIDVADHVDKPDWMGKVDYSGLKLKLIGSIVAISAIDLLSAFMHITTPGLGHLDNSQLGWMIAIHVTLIVSGVLFALMDRIAEPSHGAHE